MTRHGFRVALALVCALAIAGCGGGGATAASPSDAQLALGQKVFAARCVSCHGAKGQGVIGPKIGGGAVVEKYPNVADQRAVVANGRKGMPSWSSILSADEIDAVVRYTREVLGR